MRMSNSCQIVTQLSRSLPIRSLGQNDVSWYSMPNIGGTWHCFMKCIMRTTKLTLASHFTWNLLRHTLRVWQSAFLLVYYAIISYTIIVEAVCNHDFLSRQRVTSVGPSISLEFVLKAKISIILSLPVVKFVTWRNQAAFSLTWQVILSFQQILPWQMTWLVSDLRRQYKKYRRRQRASFEYCMNY